MQNSTSPIKRRTCKGIKTTIDFTLRSVDEDKQAPAPQQRPGYQDAKKALVDMRKQVRQDCGVIFIPKVGRQRLRNQLDPSMQWSFLFGWALIGLSTLQKNDPSRHPGGPRPLGLRTGINMNGKTVRGLRSGKMKQHRLRS